MANIITGCRILCSILLLFVPAFSPAFYIIYLVAGFTDMIDGTIARKTNTANEFGSRLDTLADIVFVVVCMINLLPVLTIPTWLWIWIGVIVIIKVFNIISGYIVQKEFVAKHTLWRKKMKVNEYQELAMTTLNPELNKRDVLINSVMGLCGESGEAIDIVKKWMAQGHELDKEHLVKELGDIAWYLAEAATALDIPLQDILQSNIDKLKKRYPEGFETKRSLVRLKGDL